MLKSLAVVCLLVQVSAADPELSVSVGESYTSWWNGQTGWGPEVVLSAGLPISAYAVLGAQASWTVFGDDGAQTTDLGLRLTATRHLGPVTVELGLGVRQTETTGEKDTLLAGRFAIGVEVLQVGAGAFELVGALERSPMLGFALDDQDPATSVMFGIGYRLRGSK